MPKKGGERDNKLVTTIVTTAAIFGARKLLAFGWQRATGKTPPDPTDPKVSLAEAAGWAVVVGVTVETTRLLAARLTARRAPAPKAE
jgi:hypothetical protein